MSQLSSKFAIEKAARSNFVKKYFNKHYSAFFVVSEISMYFLVYLCTNCILVGVAALTLIQKDYYIREKSRPTPATGRS